MNLTIRMAEMERIDAAAEANGETRSRFIRRG
jgi:hypothetical protein